MEPGQQPATVWSCRALGRAQFEEPLERLSALPLGGSGVAAGEGLGASPTTTLGTETLAPLFYTLFAALWHRYCWA